MAGGRSSFKTTPCGIKVNVPVFYFLILFRIKPNGHYKNDIHTEISQCQAFSAETQRHGFLGLIHFRIKMVLDQFFCIQDYRNCK
jgi:hypothetical protein